MMSSSMISYNTVLFERRGGMLISMGFLTDCQFDGSNFPHKMMANVMTFPAGPSACPAFFLSSLYTAF